MFLYIYALVFWFPHSGINFQLPACNVNISWMKIYVYWMFFDLRCEYKYCWNVSKCVVLDWCCVDTDSIPCIQPQFIHVPDVKSFIIFTQSQGWNLSVLGGFHCFIVGMLPLPRRIVIFTDNIDVITIITAVDMQQQKLIIKIIDS